MILAPEECVLCNESKMKSSGYEVLVKCTTIASAETLLQVASNLNNDLLEVEFTGKSFLNIIITLHVIRRKSYC